jgi:para-aminobenzoate synthetase/4-amino-4-deoxychorismate lyase
VRLRLSPTGEVQVEGGPLTALPPGPLPVALAATPVNRQDVFLFHKTTHRALYEARAAEAPGARDVLLWNEEGELTEFTTGNLVVEREGRRLTPPRTCGLLAGTARAEALAAGQVEERVLRREDLEGATRLWLLNSVRGWVPVTWQEPAGRPPPC